MFLRGLGTGEHGPGIAQLPPQIRGVRREQGITQGDERELLARLGLDREVVGRSELAQLVSQLWLRVYVVQLPDDARRADPEMLRIVRPDAQDRGRRRGPPNGTAQGVQPERIQQRGPEVSIL